MKNIRVDETVRFGVVTHHPSGGYEAAADAAPKWFVFEDGGDTAIVEGEFTARTGFVGYYRASFDATLANGFEPQKFYEIMASGTVDGLAGKTIVEEFVLDDVFNSNLMDIGSGNRTSAVESMVWDATVSSYQTSGTFGAPYDGTHNWIDANVRERSVTDIISGVWNELVINHQVSGTFGVPFDGLSNWVDTNVLGISDDRVSADNLELMYDGTGYTDDTAPASRSQLGSAINSTVSGVWDEQISDHLDNGTFGSGINKITQDFYAANIKYLRERETDDYGVSWIKNNTILASGDVTEARISVYDQEGGTALLTNQLLDYTAHIDPLLLKHTETSSIQTSGNLYRVFTSGVIDGTNREWSQIVGIDLL